MKKLGVGAVALSLLLGGGYSYSAFASSNEGSVVESLKAEVKKYEVGEKMPEIPEGATMLEEIELIKGEVKTYKEGEEMPEIPEGATMLTKEEVKE
ncbi:hypothetical protein FOH38_07215 [Lysinibacillus fusiformis]|nr:hypothetical protein FOH38_07215 [Lysinibacillus fusiformis]